VTPERLAAARGLLLADRLAELEGRPTQRDHLTGLALQHGLDEPEIRRILTQPAEACRNALRAAQIQQVS
jgi:anti-sigma regulatory factor (Ser/Thr protein kinase)